jgi:hypothetical protein
MLDFRFNKDDSFKEIRPFCDDEIEYAIKYLRNNFLFKSFLKKGLQSVFNQEVNSIIDELFRAKYISDIEKITYSGIEKIIDPYEFNIEGIANLESKKNYIYMSNHRLILKDPLFLNYALQLNNLPTAIIGIGGNLTKIKQLEYAVKMNKCFIVKRGKENSFANIKTQMQFVYNALVNNHSMWIAQGKGRSKDGNDETETNILKMLYMPFKNSGLSLNNFLTQYPIIPVSISYERDPCILDRAQILYDIQTKGNHKKKSFEDEKTMWHELHNTTKGINIHFGRPITSISNIEELKQQIDNSIHANYRLWDFNISAYKSSHEDNHAFNIYNQTFNPNNQNPNQENQPINAGFVNLISKETPKHLVSQVIQLYANPAINNIKQHCLLL